MEDKESRTGKNTNGSAILVAVLVVVTGIVAYLAWNYYQPTPADYQECLSARGSVLQESYPATCVTTKGDRFVQPLTDEEKKNLLPPKDVITSGWAQFSTDNFKFEYPIDVELIESTKGASVVKWGPTQEAQTEFYDGISLSFYLHTLNNQTIEEWVDEKINENTGVVEILKGKDKFPHLTLDGFTYTLSGLGTQRNIILVSPYDTGLIIQIVDSTSDPTNQGYAAIVEDIISSFTFIN